MVSAEPLLTIGTATAPRRAPTAFVTAATGLALAACLAAWTWWPSRAALRGSADMNGGVTDLVGTEKPQRYTHVQYLGFNLFTAPGKSSDGCLGPNHTRLDQCYLGTMKTEEDIAHRVGILREAVERTHATPHWDRSPSTLKVFMAPEFYWRGPRGAYRITKKLANISRAVISEIGQALSHENYTHWLFIDGTAVMAQKADPGFVNSSGMPYENISYYNFAPIHVGGTNRSLIEFKHFISGIDFLQATPDRQRAQLYQASPPGKTHEFCKRHPNSNGCVYGVMPEELLRRLGFSSVEVLQDGLFELNGLRIAIEICLDHAVGMAAKNLGPNRNVDLQLIVSAGMNIASGPVVTRTGGPVLLADGFARTELSLNQYGHGREKVRLPDGRAHYNAGLVYGADAIVALRQWIADAMDALTGTGFGTRTAGQATLPGGSAATGPTGIPFKQVKALGEDWLEQLSGFYNVASYKEAQKVFKLLEGALRWRLTKEHRETLMAQIDRAQLFPTVDIYGPVPLPGNSE